LDAHIFIDNSNAFGGAQRAASVEEPKVLWVAVRLHFRSLVSLIEDGLLVRTRVLTGSIPPGNEALWDYARQAGYNTDLLRRIESEDGRLVEQGVDELAHLKIANALLDFDPPQTLILVTGDGAAGEFQTSFVNQAERALRRGWNVVVWSWREQLSGRFQRLRVPSGQSLLVRHLDPFYRAITFVQAGTYRFNGMTITCEGRIVRPLRLAANPGGGSV